MTILVGCSGWSYDDWVGKFYPMELGKRKGDWFSYYANYFQTVEMMTAEGFGEQGDCRVKIDR